MNGTGSGWLAVGRLDYRYTIAVETGDEIQVASLGVFNYLTTDGLSRRWMGTGSPKWWTPRTPDLLRQRLDAGRLDALRALDDQTQQLEAKVSELYDRMER